MMHTSLMYGLIRFQADIKYSPIHRDIEHISRSQQGRYSFSVSELRELFKIWIIKVYLLSQIKEMVARTFFKSKNKLHIHVDFSVMYTCISELYLNFKFYNSACKLAVRTYYYPHQEHSFLTQNDAKHANVQCTDRKLIGLYKVYLYQKPYTSCVTLQTRRVTINDCEYQISPLYHDGDIHTSLVTGYIYTELRKSLRP